MVAELVSIIIPCYNGEKFIDDCLNGLLNQSYKKLEVIVINDGSTDNSLDKLESYIGKFKKVGMIYKIINKTNQGQAAAINDGLEKVSGEYLMWQDIDDMYDENAVANFLDFFYKNKEINIVRGEVEYRSEDLKSVIGYGKSKDALNQYIFDEYVFETDTYCFSGIFMIKMKHFDNKIKNRKIYPSRAGQNWQLILPNIYNEKCGYLAKKVYICRIVENSHSHKAKSLKDLLRRCNDHKDILYHIIDVINMNKVEKLKYKWKINLKYIKKKLILRLQIIKRIISKIKKIIFKEN